MKVLRWISCHLILVIVILSVLVMWLIRQDLATDYARLMGRQAPQRVASNDHSEADAPPVDAVTMGDRVDNREVTTPSHVSPPPDSGWVASPDTYPPQSAGPAPAPEQMPTPMSQQVTVAEPVHETPAVFPEDNLPESDSPGTSVEPMNPVEEHPQETPLPGSEIPSQGTGYQLQSAPAPTPVQGHEPAQAESVVQSQTTKISSLDMMFPPEDYDPETGPSNGSNAGNHLLPGSGRAPRSGYESFDGSTPPSGAEPGAEFPAGDIVSESTGKMLSRQSVPGLANQASDDFRSRLEHARNLFMKGDLDKARQEYEAMMRQFPAQPEPASELGNLLMQQNKVEDANKMFDTAVRNFRQQRRDNEAIGLIRFISRYNPTLADTLYNKYWQSP